MMKRLQSTKLGFAWNSGWLLALLFICSTGAYLQAGIYNSRSTEKCITSSTGAGATVSFNFANTPPATDSVTLWVIYRGDLNSSTEVFDIADENSNSIGATNNQLTQCGTTPDSTKFMISATTFNGWIANGSVDFDATARSAVSATLCTFGSCARMSLNYLTVSGPDDAGASEVLPIATSECPANQNVEAVISNFGTNLITSLDVNWSVNGVTQSLLSYSGTLDTLNGSGNFQDTVSLGSFAFVAGNFDIKVWTSNPNGNTDTVNINDSILSVQAPLAPPAGLNDSNLTPTSADIFWTATGSNSYSIIYDTAGFDPATSGTNTTGTTPISLTGLQSATDYDVYLIGDCGSGQFTDTAGPHTFKTLCAFFNAPYSENFDNATIPNMPTCWDSIMVGSRTNFADVETYQFSGPRSTPQHLRLYNYFNNDTIMAVSPPFSDITSGDKRVKFWAKSTTFDVSDLYVGTLASPTDGGSFVILDTIPTANLGTYTEFIVNIDSANGYNGTHQYIGFMHDNSNNFDAIYIDDFNYEVIPPCPDPRQATFSNITDSSAVVNFVSSNATTFEFNWGPCGFTQGSPTSIFKNGAKPFTIDSNLLPNTCYDLYIKSDCGAVDGKSNWAGPFSFRTDCAPLTAPYSLSFDVLTAGAEVLDPCWNRYLVGASTQFSDFENYAFATPRSTPNHLRIYNYNNDTTLGLTPTFGDLTAGDKRIKMWVKSGSAFNAVNSDIWIGTVGDRSRIGATLTIIDTIPVGTNTTYTQHIINIDSANGYNGTDQTIAIMHSNGGNFDIIYVDDFVYETIPPCQGPLGSTLTTSFIGSNAARADWGSGGQGDETFVRWGLTGFDPNNTLGLGTDSVRGNVDDYLITGLSAQTTYDYYLMDSCAGIGLGNWIGPLTFTTACAPLNAPYTEDFDNTTNWSGSSTIDPCWISNAPGGFAHAWTVTSGTTPSSSTGPSSDNTSGSGQYLFTETSSSTPSLAVIETPLIDVSSLNVPFFEFYYHRYGTDMGTLTVEANDGNGWQNLTTLVGDDQTSSADPWKVLGFDLSSFRDTVQVRFSSTRGNSFRGDGAIDDVSFKEGPSCPPPAGLVANAADTTALFNWRAVGNANDYQVWIGASGFYQGTNTNGGVKGFTGGPDSLRVDTFSTNTGYEFLVRAICGSGDTSIWVGPVSFKTLIRLPQPLSCNTGGPSVVFSEEFADNSAGWTGDIGSFGGNWEIPGTPTSSSTGPDSQHSGPVGSFTSFETSGASNTTGSLVSPAISLTNGNSDAELSFWMYAYGSDMGTLNVGVSSSSTGPFTNIFTQVGEIQTAGNLSWINVGADLSSYVGQTIYLEFAQTHSSGFRGDMAIDLVEVSTCVTCPRPGNTRVTNITASSAFIDWNAVAPAVNGYDVIYGTTGFNPASGGTNVNTTADSITLSSLSSNTAYEVYLVSDCGTTNGTSDTAGPLSFRTPCIPFTAPYTQDFDGTTAPALDPCWTPYLVGQNIRFADVETYSFGTPNSTPNHLRLYNYFSNDTIMAISPEFTDMTAGDKQVELYIKAGSTFNTVDLWVGTMSDPSRGSTLNIIDTIVVQGNTTYQQAVVELNAANGYNGTDDHVVLMHDNSGSFDVIYVDDFTYETIPACPEARGFQMLSTTDTSGRFTFSSSDTLFNFNWGPAGFTQGSATSGTGSGGKPFTINGLNGNTQYDVYIQTNCTADSNGFSSWAGPFTFRTDCGSLTAPYSHSFDNLPAGSEVLDPCWNRYLVGSSSRFSDVENYAFVSPRSTPNHLRMYNYNNDTTMGITPRFSDLTKGDKRVRFWVKAGSSFNGADLRIGTMSDPTRGATLTIIDTILVGGNTTYTEVTANIDSANGYNGTDQYVALVHAEGTGTAAFDVIYIDDFVYEDIPPCLAPSSSTLGALSITASNALAKWGNAGQGDETFIRWGTTGFDPNTSVGLGTDSVRGNDTTYLITGLSPQTTYDFYIEDSCAGKGLSGWIGPFTFTTACLPVTAPFTENFDDNTVWTSSAIDACWASNGPSGFAHKWQANSGSTGSFNTGPSGDNTSGSGQYIYTETSSGTPSIAEIKTPLIDVSTLNVPFFEFYYHRYGSTMGDLDVEINDGTGWVNLTTLVGDDQTSSSDPWKPLGFDISAYGDTVQIRFSSTRGTSFRGDGAIDDVSITEAPTCPKVTNLSVSGIVDSAAVLNWDTSRGANRYQVWLGSSGFFQGTNVTTGQKGFANANSLRVDTLSGNTCYDFLVRPVCAPGDTGEWTGPFTFCTPCSAFNAPYFENFDNLSTFQTGDLGNCWNSTPDNTFSYSWRTNSGTTSSSSTGPNGDATSGNGVYLYTEASSGSNGDSTLLVSPIVNVSSLSNPELRFAYHMYGSSINALHVDVHDGTKWNRSVFSISGGQQTSNAAPWRDTAVSLSSYGNRVQVRFRGLKGISVTGDISIDDVEFDDPITCPVPTNLGASNALASSFDLNWNAGTSASNDFQISYGAGLTNPAAGTTLTVNASTSTTITNVMSATNYCAFVREICGPADTSHWVGPVCITTACTVFNLPYSENFDGSSWVADNSNFSAANSVIGACWNRDPDNGTDYSWRVRSTSTGSASTGPNTDATGGNFVYTEASSGRSGDSASLISPLIDLRGASNPELSYGYYFYGSQIDRMLIEANDGTGWTLLSTRIGQTQTSSTSPWQYDTVSLNAVSGSIVKLRFRSVSNGCCAGDMALDSVSVSGTLSCTVPNNLAATANVGCDSIEVDWTSNTGGSIIQWGAQGFTPGSGNFTGIITNPFTASGLTPNTSYDFWVADTCGSDTSAFAGPVTVTTASGPLPVANINVLGDTILGSQKLFFLDGSSSTDADTYLWDFGNGASGTMAVDTATYAVSGSFTITLIVTNACGSDTAAVNLTSDIGLEENALSRSLNMYPNPTRELVNIEFDAAQSGDATIRITDMRGRVMMERNESHVNGRYNEAIDVSYLANGVYMVEITSGELRAVRRLNIK